MHAGKSEQVVALFDGDRGKFFTNALRPGGMTMDENGRYYVATALGVQVFDPTGRECGLIPKPTDTPMTSVFLGGPGGNRKMTKR